MVAQTVQRASNTFRGARPINPSRDLPAVALLLEESFREDLGMMHAWARVPIMREIGAAILSTAFMPVPPDMLRGFVWEENGHIVGNVTLTLDDTRTGRWLISNVAVAEKFRQRGIARQLMIASISEASERGAHWLVLNVRPFNTPAIRLYESLSFETVDTEMNYIRTRARTLTTPPLPLRRMNDAELRAAFELAKKGMTEKWKMFRPPTLSDFGVRVEDRMAERLTDFVIAQSTERRGYFEGSELKGVVYVRAQRIGSPHAIDVRVAPAARGPLENGLVAAALARLERFPAREVSAKILTSHTALRDALADAGFIPTRGLTLMAREIKT